MNLKEIDLRKIYRAWKKGLGPYRCFFRSSPFVSLQTYDDFEIINCNDQVNKKILSSILKESDREYFVIADFKFDEILNIALKLNNEYHIKPILNINLLFNPFGIVGTKYNISRLLNYAYRINDINTDRYIMLLPYDRYDEKIDVSTVYDKLNNQYAVGFDDLPTVEFIKRLGYKGITIVTKDKIKEDLKDYVNYISNDVKVNLVEVDD